MKAIQIKTNNIEIPFVDKDGNTALVLYFDKTDENIQRFYDEMPEIGKMQETENHNLESNKKHLERLFDVLLGEGAFKQVYELNPSLMVLMAYFVQIVDGIVNELNTEGLVEQEVRHRYLGN